jgi:hypothetical protein
LGELKNDKDTYKICDQRDGHLVVGKKDAQTFPS